jgi:hypothetical protein
MDAPRGSEGTCVRRVSGRGEESLSLGYLCGWVPPLPGIGLWSGAVTSASVASAAAVSQHVLLISVDGPHQADLDWYVAHHPKSALAALTKSGTSYPHARTPASSDSFPATIAQFTGGDPATTGVYYDVLVS